MRTIFKYKLRPTVSLPKDSVILKTAIQNGEMFIWVLIYPNETQTNIHNEVSYVNG